MVARAFSSISCESTDTISRFIASRTRRIDSPLRDRPHQILARQHAQHVIAKDHGEILLPAIQNVIDGLWTAGSSGWTIRKWVSMACCTGIPPSELCICAMADSCSAPIQTNKAMKTRNGSVQQSDKTKQKGNELAHPRRHQRGASVFQTRGQQGAQHAAAIHGKSRNQVKRQQPEVHHHQIVQKAATRPAKVLKLRANPGQKARRRKARRR